MSPTRNNLKRQRAQPAHRSGNRDSSRGDAGRAGSTGQPVVAAIFNTSPDIVDLLRTAIERAGIVTVSAMTHQIREGVVDVESFLRQHNPAVVVYDIAPPYDANWNLFQHISEMASMRERPVVLTSTNPRQVEKLAGRDHRIYEVVGKPLDLNEIVRAIKEATRARPTR